MNRAVDFADPPGCKAGLRELAIDVAGENPGTMRLFGRHTEQQAEAGVWFGAAVEVEAMAVETPG